MIEAIETLICFDQWTKSPFLDRDEVKRAEEAVSLLVQLMVKFLPNPVYRKTNANVEELEVETSVEEDQKTDQPTTPPRNRRSRKSNSPTKPTGCPKPKSDKQKGSRKKKKREVINAGSNGWHKYKFHQLLHLLDEIVKFGNMSNFSGESGEEHHKYFTKLPGKNTQRRLSSFTWQVSQRNEEADLIEHVHREYQSDVAPISRSNRPTPSEYYRENANNDIGNVTPANVNFLTKKGEFTVIFQDSGYQGTKRTTSGKAKSVMRNVPYVSYWKDPRKNIQTEMNLFPIHNHFLHAIVAWGIQRGYTGEYSITGFTELRVPGKDGRGSTIYHASPNLQGEEWYDWAYVEFPPYLVDEQVCGYCVGRILGFFRWNTKSFPTLLRHHKQLPHNLADTDADPTLYVVLETNDDWLDMEELEMRLVTPFSLFKDDQGMYILPATAIMNPMIVVQDWESTSAANMLAILPQRKWPTVFSRFIRNVHGGVTIDDMGKKPKKHDDKDADEQEGGVVSMAGAGVEIMDNDPLVPEYEANSDADIEQVDELECHIDVESGDEQREWEDDEEWDMNV